MEPVLFETDGAVAVIRLNRPEARNAIDSAMATALQKMINKLETDDGLRAGVLAGEGRVFCAGMDLGAFAAGDRPGITDPDGFALFVRRPRRKPIVAAVQGAAMAGGFEILLACEMAVAAEGALFALPEVRRGLIAAGGGAFRLPRRVPPAIAHEMLLTGEPIGAERALALGLVNAVVPAEGLIEAAKSLARKVAANAPLVVAETMALARAEEEDAWARNAAAWALIDGSADALEGARAFKEKREPVWSGR